MSPAMTAEKVEPPDECRHDLAERETATACDGLCPVCLLAALKVTEQRCEFLRTQVADLVAGVEIHYPLGPRPR